MDIYCQSQEIVKRIASLFLEVVPEECAGIVVRIVRRVLLTENLNHSEQIKKTEADLIK